MTEPDFFYDNRTTEPESIPGIDLTRPSAARMYDLMLGGKDNFAADQRALDELLAEVLELRTMAVENRRWQSRIVRFLAESGVTQFLDVGSGLPAQYPSHQVARRHSPHRDPRVVYVDHDAMVVSHSRALLASDTPSTTAVIPGDLREPEQILTHPDVRAFIDFDIPVAVLMIAVLHFLPEDQYPHRAVRRLREALPSGSYIAISHVDNARAPARARYLERFYTERGIPGQTRSPEQIADFFEQTEIVPPGLGYIEDWRPDLAVLKTDGTQRPLAGPPLGPDQVGVYGGLGRIR